MNCDEFLKALLLSSLATELLIRRKTNLEQETASTLKPEPGHVALMHGGTTRASVLLSCVINQIT